MYSRYIPDQRGGFVRTSVPDRPPAPAAPQVTDAGPAPPVPPPPPGPPVPGRTGPGGSRPPGFRRGPGPPPGFRPTLPGPLSGLFRRRDPEDWLILAVLVLGLLSDGADMTTALLAAGLYLADF